MPSPTDPREASDAPALESFAGLPTTGPPTTGLPTTGPAAAGAAVAEAAGAAVVAEGTRRAREHRELAMRELPDEAFRLGRGDPVLPTIFE